MRLLSKRRLAAHDLREFLLGKPAVASLGWKDFAHLRALRDLAARIVAKAGDVDDDAGKGVNILIYGPPGTGKSEFAGLWRRVLACKPTLLAKKMTRALNRTERNGSPPSSSPIRSGRPTKR